MPPRDRGTALRNREDRDLCPHARGDCGDVPVVAVKDDPAFGLRDATDRCLDLRQLGQGVDALEIEMVGGDIGEHAGIIRLVAHAAQDDPSAGGLQDGDVDVGSSEDLARTARSRPVAGVDHALVDQDAVGGCRADMSPGQQQDVRDQARRGALAVGAAYRNDGDASIGVAQPGWRRAAGSLDSLIPASDQPRPAAGLAIRSRRGDVALGEVEGCLGDLPGAVRTAPRVGQDPMAGVR